MVQVDRLEGRAELVEVAAACEVAAGLVGVLMRSDDRGSSEGVQRQVVQVGLEGEWSTSRGGVGSLAFVVCVRVCVCVEGVMQD